MNEQAAVITSISNTTGVIRLNRPRAINALTPEMVEAVAQSLREWRDDAAITQVLVLSNSEKGFCSGGDVRWAREQVLAGKAAKADEFFAVEYAMNREIAEFPKPYVSLIDGVVMGGGLGISAHGSHRVITPAAFASMPETAIGYVTDVGMSQVFQTLRFGPATGRFLALTGYRLTAADMLASGLATHHVDAADGVAEAIVEKGVDQALAELATQPEEQSRLAELINDIDATFGHDTWAEIDRALKSHDNAEFVSLVRELTAGASPTSLARSTELMAANLEVDLAQALDNERVMGEKMRRHPDFVEGVRAVLVDKTRDAEFATAP